MVFDAHNRAFAFLKGTCTRGIYDNMKTAGAFGRSDRRGCGRTCAGLLYSWPAASPGCCTMRSRPRPLRSTLLAAPFREKTDIFCESDRHDARTD
jgi:hypothetical protein